MALRRVNANIATETTNVTNEWKRPNGISKRNHQAKSLRDDEVSHVGLVTNRNFMHYKYCKIFKRKTYVGIEINFQNSFPWKASCQRRVYKVSAQGISRKIRFEINCKYQLKFRYQRSFRFMSLKWKTSLDCYVHDFLWMPAIREGRKLWYIITWRSEQRRKHQQSNALVLIIHSQVGMQSN